MEILNIVALRCQFMIRSWHGNNFHTNGLLSGETTSYQWIPYCSKGPVVWCFKVFFVVCITKRYWCKQLNSYDTHVTCLSVTDICVITCEILLYRFGYYRFILFITVWQEILYNSSKWCTFGYLGENDNVIREFDCIFKNIGHMTWPDCICNVPFKTE